MIGPDGFGLEDAPPGTALLCGASLEGDGRICGAPAFVHAWPGSPPDTRADFTVYSCSEHVIRPEHLWDAHLVSSGACGIPGAKWQSGDRQYEGRCVHEIGADL